MDVIHVMKGNLWRRANPLMPKNLRKVRMNSSDFLVAFQKSKKFVLSFENSQILFDFHVIFCFCFYFDLCVAAWAA